MLATSCGKTASGAAALRSQKGRFVAGAAYWFARTEEVRVRAELMEGGKFGRLRSTLPATARPRQLLGLGPPAFKPY
jgi:hypothetical protein